ncbi:hypothetical protein SNE40_000744 [Patella caerulea]
MFSQVEVEKIALLIHSSKSPVDQLILELGGKGFCVKDLAEILLEMKMEKTLFELVEYIPIKIVKQPASYIEVGENKTIKLSVEAFGLPFPRYQWFKGDDEVPGAMEATLQIDDIRDEDEGIYCCRLHNSRDPALVKFTTESEVKVHLKHNLKLTNSDEDDLGKGGSVCLHHHIINHPRSMSVLLGSSFTLVCEVSGNQPVQYIWYHNQEFFTETSSPYLQVDNATEYHNGHFHCVVKSSFFEVKSKKATINVTVHRNSISKAISPEIITQPKSCIVAMGGVALFCCEAKGSRPINYQWFKDGEVLPGSITSEYKISNIMSVQQEGLYQCLVSNRYATKLSQGAFLKINTCLNEPVLSPDHTATDKVALLIGNYEYRCERRLNAPKADISNLSEIFSNLNFKVVSLLNLTLIEMKNAVDNFCELLGPGVYGVFYFCGHGFEENKSCYLVPEDAPTGYVTSHCLSVDYVQSKMQKQETEVSCLILDVCRTANKVTCPEVSVPDYISMEPSLNTVICYATSCGQLAFENANNGLLVLSLQKFLYTRISIEEVFAKVREDFGISSNIFPKGKIQNPEVKSNLKHPGRSFCDEIQYTGHTQAYTRRQLDWERCLLKPDDTEFVANPQELGIILQLNFQTEFSNVLTVFITVKNPGITQNCIAYIGKHPNTISLMGDPTEVTSDGTFRKTKNTLQDIQKIKDKLVITIYIKYSLDGKNYQSEDTLVVLDYPLVAKLQLWRDMKLPCRREPTEQEDN